MNAEAEKQTFFSGLGVALRDALLITAVAGAVGLLVNLFHPEKIPYIAEEEYETLVPCPEPGGEVTLLEANDPLVRAKDSFVVDARRKTEHQDWKLGEAMNIPYDYLEPRPEERRVLETRARKVVVYGDGENPDSGEQLANAISGKGVKNVFFVRGGAPALRRGRAP